MARGIRHARHGSQGAVEFADQAVHRSSLAEKKRAPAGARFFLPALLLEPMRHADEGPAHVRTQDWGVRSTGAQLAGRHSGPRELRVSVVVDLRVLDTEAGALREAVLITEEPLLGAGLAEEDRPLHVLHLGIGRLDRAQADGNGQGNGIALRLDVARSAAERGEGRARAANGGGAYRAGKEVHAAIVDHVVVNDTKKRKAEVEATFERPAVVGLADRREVLMPIDRNTRAGPATHAGPLDGGRPHLWGRVHGRLHARRVRDADGLELRYLPHEVELRATESGGRIANHVRSATPEGMADSAATDDRVALRRRVRAGSAGAARCDEARRARQVCRSGRIR